MAICMRDIVKILVVVVLWAICYPLITTGLETYPPLHFATLRSLLAGACLLIAGLMLKKTIIPERRTWPGLIIISLTFTTLGFTGMFLAGGRVTPGLATGNLGLSFLRREPVGQLILARLWPTLKLALVAMGVALQTYGIDTTLFNESSIPAVYRFLPGVERISRTLEGENPFDTAIVLDCSNLDRVGSRADQVSAVPVVINIDHHVTNNGFGDLQIIDSSACATADASADRRAASPCPATTGASSEAGCPVR